MKKVVSIESRKLTCDVIYGEYLYFFGEYGR